MRENPLFNFANVGTLRVTLVSNLCAINWSTENRVKTNVIKKFQKRNRVTLGNTQTWESNRHLNWVDIHGALTPTSLCIKIIAACVTLWVHYNRLYASNAHNTQVCSKWRCPFLFFLFKTDVCPKVFDTYIVPSLNSHMYMHTYAPFSYIFKIVSA